MSFFRGGRVPVLWWVLGVIDSCYWSKSGNNSCNFVFSFCCYWDTVESLLAALQAAYAKCNRRQRYMIEFPPTASLTQQCDCDNPSNMCMKCGLNAPGCFWKSTEKHTVRVYVLWELEYASQYSSTLASGIWANGTVNCSSQDWTSAAVKVSNKHAKVNSRWLQWVQLYADTTMQPCCIYFKLLTSEGKLHVGLIKMLIEFQKYLVDILYFILH